MAQQARGSNARIAFGEEATWGETPTNPSTTLLKAATYGANLGGNMEEITSEAITDARALENARGGNIDVSGSIPIEMPIVGFGTLLKHAMGSVTTGQNAVPPDSPAITGVEILYAEQGATAGDGSLDYVASTTELTWTAPSDTAGPAVDVSAGGDFTLESGSTGEALTVRVDAASLPGSDATDTITVESRYRHRLTRGDLPTGLFIEVGFTDIGTYIVFNGCKINSLSFTVANSGIVTGSMEVMGRDYTINASEVATPATVDHTPLVHHEASVLVDEVTSKVQNLEMTINNNLNGDAYVIGDRYRDQLNEGQGQASGSITVQFRDQTWLDRWSNETEFSLETDFVNSLGELNIQYPRCKLFENAVPALETAQGIVQSMSLRPLRSNDGDNSDVVFDLVNDQAAI